MKVPELHPNATKELIESAQYLNEATPGLGDRFLDDFFKVLKRIGKYPESGFRISGGVRGAKISVFRYDVIYRLEQSRIYIIAIAHQRRKPGYWRGRI
ncbi:MAG: type II toxin-antitoxin system RelE/ParE family toxin [Thermoanaerobaculia bacterium]